MKLQNNFTTPEQSKRLLKLGVPADTADVVIPKDEEIPSLILSPCITFTEYNTIQEGSFLYQMGLRTRKATPCWSVGRLMEIWEICGNGGRCVTVKKGQSRIESLVKLYEENAFYADFSKLEE